MLGIQKIVISGIYKKLTAVCIRACVSHGYRAGVIFIVRSYFVGKYVTGSAGAPHSHLGVIAGQRVTSLNHKALYNSMKFYAVIETLARQFYEIGHRVGSLLFKKFYCDITLVGTKCCVHSFLCLLS